MGMTFGLLGAAVIALWAGGARKVLRVPVWAWLWLGALGCALAQGLVRPLGLAGIAGWIGVVAWRARAERGPTLRGGRWAPAVAVLAFAAALMLHRVPGFANPRVIDAVRFTPDALPFTLYLNFDKTLIGLFLFAAALPRIASPGEWRMVLSATAPRAAVTIAVVLVASLALGYVRWAPKFPPEAPLWLAVNLLFTCTAEEALFRGVIQGGLRRAWAAHRAGPWAALAVGAVLFGLAHAAGGWRYVALATLAGAGYGWAYERTQRVEASVLTHFALNTAHFFLFTYPALAGAVPA